MMDVVCGMPPPIRYGTLVKPMKRDFLKEYNHETYYFCNSCSVRLTEHFGLYENVDCSLFRIDVNRA
ncbi:hypothetical protein Q1695_012112 [Nippostrongylus brasiliensis]|nr:hypothetical protein Q1695_012112 [Nippostrongylus brasiliensis]